MIKAIRKITLVTILGLSTMGCNNTGPIYHPEVIGSKVNVIEYLKWRGQTPCELFDDRDFDGDGINDPYLRPQYNLSIIYHTNSRDPQPMNDREIRWYLLRE